MVPQSPLMVNQMPLIVSLSNHELERRGLILRQAQDERAFSQKEPLMVNKEPLMVSLSNHEQFPTVKLTLRQTQGERTLYPLKHA